MGGRRRRSGSTNYFFYYVAGGGQNEEVYGWLSGFKGFFQTVVKVVFYGVMAVSPNPPHPIPPTHREADGHF